MKRVGKVGRANIEANKRIRVIVQERGINYCEMQLEGCLRNWPLQVAHRHKRAYYKGDPDKLADENEWVIACDHCHRTTEWNRPLNDEVFSRLRPNNLQIF